MKTLTVGMVGLGAVVGTVLMWIVGVCVFGFLLGYFATMGMESYYAEDIDAEAIYNQPTATLEYKI